MAESNPPQKKTPIDYISDSESSEEELNQHFYVHPKKRDTMTPLRDQLTPLKHHYHTLWLSVTLQLNEDLTEN